MAEALTDFSQSKEQELILDIFSDAAPGSFLDIGAGDGKTFSNTQALVRRRWRGVCIEPSPNLFERLLQDSTQRLQCLNVVVVPDGIPRLTAFYYVKGDFISSLEEKSPARWGVDVRKMWVMSCPVFDLVRDMRLSGEATDFISVDTEGSSVEIAQALLRESCNPRCWCVEAENKAQRRILHQMLDGWPEHADTVNNVLAWR